MGYIAERLAELDADRQELARYQALDKQRRGLEYALYDKELSKTREELAQVRRKAANLLFSMNLPVLNCVVARSSIRALCCRGR